MAKKSDILLEYYNEFPEYLEEHKIRSKELERNFLSAKNDYQSYLNKIDDDFKQKEDKLAAKFFQIELFHSERNNNIKKEYNDQLLDLESQVENHNNHSTSLYDDEDDKYQEVLNQFEERKAEAFNTYLKLTKETNYRIDKEMKIHTEFIGEEKVKLDAKKIEYQDLNSTLSNKLLWTMEKAKNALAKLSSSLTEEGEQNKTYLDETINDSLNHLSSSKEGMMALFKTSTIKFEKERNEISDITKDKRKPHSELNQKMISTFIKQIRDVNDNKNAFDKMIKRELELSLENLYPKIIEADAKNNQQVLQKYILQKEIIQNKVNYLLKRNQSMSDLLISKYQNEIKKIKIDSFKRFEEIQTTYSVPVAFLENTVNVYSNFAFYLNETYEDLYRMLNNFKKYNSDYIKYKTDYIHTSQKSFEDYKINLLVKVNDITNHLTDYISRIDEISNQIVTLESNNRLEIADIRKKLENLDVFGDYQKYISSLENDQYYAFHQHNKNLEKIQIESSYTSELLDINRDVLSLNQNKLEYTEYNQYMLEVAHHEKDIQELGHLRKIEEAKAMYQQQIDKVVALRELAREQIIYHAKKTNYGYASSYANYLDTETKKNKIGSEKVIDFVHHVQNLINLNTNQASKVDQYVKQSNASNAYLRSLEENRLNLILQVDKTTYKKNQICQTACDIYETEILKIQNEFHNIFNKYINLMKDHLLLLQSVDTSLADTLRYNGYKQEISSAIQYINKQTIILACKYQISDQLVKIEETFEDNLGKFLFVNIKTFKKSKKTKNSIKVKSYLESYYIETYTILNEYEAYINNVLAIILARTTANDRSFIKNTETKASRTKEIINKEYEKLQFYAIKHSKSQKKQINHYRNYSTRLNNIYKKQVSNINKEYLSREIESKALSEDIYNDFLKIVRKNNKELKQMVKFMDKMFNQEQKQLNKQYDKFQKSLSHIVTVRESTYSSEVAYINNLYSVKELSATKTIHILENKMTKLPIIRDNRYLGIKKEKYQLQKARNKLLNKNLAEIEKEKYVSRPKYLAEMDRVKDRLPDDYMSLYSAVQNLEFEFLNQFTKINDSYNQNYKDYLLNQSGNNELIEPNSPLYQGFEDLHIFNTNMMTSTTETYKESSNKSQRIRGKLKKQRQESEARQKRIINE